MASTDALPVPLKNTAYRVVFPIYDADGDLVTGAVSLDSEVSKDQGTFADCTNEATEIATSSGMYYLDLTSTEMNADCVSVIVKTASSGAKTAVLVFYPAETGDIPANVTAFGGTAGTFASGRPEVNTSHLAGSAVSTSSAQIGVNVVNAGGTAWGSGAITAGAIASDAITAAKVASDVSAEIADAVWDEARSGHTTDGTFGQINQAVRSGTAQGGGTNTITLDASASATDDLYNGCLVWIVSSTGAGQAGVITDYVGSTKVATVDNNWRTNPNSSSVFVILPGSLGLTSATLASSVWDASTATYNGAGTFGAGVRLSAAAVQSIWDALTSALTTVGSIGKRIVDYLTGDAYARLGAPVGASISADIAAVQADTDNLQTRIPAALVSGRMDASVGAYQSGLTPLQPTVAGRTLDVSAGGEAGVDWANVGSPTTAVALTNTYVFGLESGGLADVAEAVWEEAIADHSGTSGSTAEQLAAAGASGDPWATAVPGSYSAGQAGKVLADILDDTGTSGVVVGSHTTGAKAEINAEADTALSDYGALKPTTAGRTLDVSAGGEAGVDWANVGSPTTTVGLSGTTVGTVSAVTAISTGGITAGSIAADAIGASELASDAVTEIQSGLATAANLATLTSYVDTEVAAIKAKTDNLPASPAATGDAMTLTSGERNSVADALLNRGLDGAGASSRKVREALAFMRNKWAISGSTLTVYDVDDSTTLFTATITSASGNPVTSVDPA